MSTAVTSAPAEKMKIQSSKPSFFGMLGGELFKISHQWITWIMLVLIACIIALPYIITLTVPDVKDTINHTPLIFLANRMTQNLAVLRHCRDAKIAAARKLSADELARLNGTAADVELRAGQEIKLPGAGASAQPKSRRR